MSEQSLPMAIHDDSYTQQMMTVYFLFFFQFFTTDKFFLTVNRKLISKCKDKHKEQLHILV